MASNWTVCGVCDSLELAKPSVIWCSECYEGLCAECDKHHAVSKASRTHSTIPITDYKKLPKDILEITHNCLKHNERYQIYCRKHDCPCCRRCVIESHNDCKDITAIDDIIKDVKSSNALYDIKFLLLELAENFEKITKDRKDNLTSLKDEKRKIEIEIQQTRIKINSNLDQMQEDLIKDLNTKEEKERKKIKDLLTSLEKRREDIDKYKMTLSNIKQHASELQIYLSIKQMETYVANEERLLETLASSESLKQVVLSFEDYDAFQMISNFKYIVQIEVEMRPSEIMVKKIKEKQAQLEVVNTSPRLIKNIKLNLKQTINTGLTWTTGCLILPDDRLVLSCRSNNHVKIFSGEGNNDFEIVLKPCNVMDITFIPEDNTIAATSGGDGSRSMYIIDIKDRKVCRKISVKSLNYGIVYNDAKLITCAKDEGLHILQNGNSKVIDVLKVQNMPSFSYVAAFDNKIYYTNRDYHTVTCCDMKGTNLWTFKDESVLKFPRGITLDNDGNIYVANQNSHTVIVMSSDGKRFSELLSAKDGISFPNALDYDRSKNQLLVANNSMTAFLFQVESKK